MCGGAAMIVCNLIHGDGVEHTCDGAWKIEKLAPVKAACPQ